MEYWPEKSFKWPADQKPRLAWRHLPRTDYHLTDNLQYACTPTAIASIMRPLPRLLAPTRLRLAWTKDGWVDTRDWDDVWDDDATYDHLDLDLDLG